MPFTGKTFGVAKLKITPSCDSTRQNDTSWCFCHTGQCQAKVLKAGIIFALKDYTSVQ